MQGELALVALFVIATAVAILARRVKIPYTVALVTAGLTIGATGLMTPPHLTKELLYAVFLPGLIFEAAYALEYRRFVQNKWTIISLALPGLLVAISLTALLVQPALSRFHLVEGFGIMHALVFASVIAATDPIAVVGLFKSLGAPHRLRVLVEGESLLNDGTAAVLFLLVLDVATGGAFSVPTATLAFVRTVGLGLMVGAAVGLLATFVIQKIDDPMIEITVTTIAAYGSFVAAEHFHLSGVIATVTAGMLCGNYASRTGMSATTRVAVGTFWEYLAFALNSIVFLLIGFEVHVSDLIAAYKPVLIAYLAVTIGRAAVIHGVGLLLKRSRERVPTSWLHVLTWGGLRGGLSMVLVLGLPKGMAHRDLIITMTFGVVILSILVQGTTMAPLLRRLGLIEHSEALAVYDRLRGRLHAERAALRELRRLEAEHVVDPASVMEVRKEYEARSEETRKELDAAGQHADWLRAEERRTVRRIVITAQKDALAEAQRAGRLATENYEELVAKLDEALHELTESHEPETPVVAGFGPGGETR